MNRVRCNENYNENYNESYKNLIKIVMNRSKTNVSFDQGCKI